MGYHLNKMGIKEDGKCRWCDARYETTSHLMCRCPAFVGTRFREWGVPMLEPGKLRSFSYESILNVVQTINKRL